MGHPASLREGRDPSTTLSSTAWTTTPLRMTLVSVDYRFTSMRGLGVRRSTYCPALQLFDQEVPGFFVFFEFGSVAAAALDTEGMDVEQEASFNFGGGDQVPDVVLADEGGEEIDLIGSVGEQLEFGDRRS